MHPRRGFNRRGPHLRTNYETGRAKMLVALAADTSRAARQRPVPNLLQRGGADRGSSPLFPVGVRAGDSLYWPVLFCWQFRAAFSTNPLQADWWGAFVFETNRLANGLASNSPERRSWPVLVGQLKVNPARSFKARHSGTRVLCSAQQSLEFLNRQLRRSNNVFHFVRARRSRSS